MCGVGLQQVIADGAGESVAEDGQRVVSEYGGSTCAGQRCHPLTDAHGRQVAERDRSQVRVDLELDLVGVLLARRLHDRAVGDALRELHVDPPAQVLPERDRGVQQRPLGFCQNVPPPASRLPAMKVLLDAVVYPVVYRD